MDLHGDGRKGLLSGSWPGELHFFKRKANGTFAASEKLTFADGKPIKVGSASAVAAGDLHGEGKLDLVIGNIEGAVFLVRNTGTAQRPAFLSAEPLKAGGQPLKVAGDAGPCLADWDGDGRLDLLLGSGAGGVVWCRNTGSAQKPEFTSPIVLVPPPGHDSPKRRQEFENPTGPSARTKVAVADWNGDGKLDLLVGDFAYFDTGKREANYQGFVWVFLRQ